MKSKNQATCSSVDKVEEKIGLSELRKPEITQDVTIFTKSLKTKMLHLCNYRHNPL